MKKALSIVALLSLTGCTTAHTFAPSTTDKVVVLSKAGLRTYCLVPLKERLAIRNDISTDDRRIAACCNKAECQVLFGGSYIGELQK
jgi:hypothetical protein